MPSQRKIYIWCEDCKGSGKKADGSCCPHCGGTGKVALWTTGKRRFQRYLTNLPITVRSGERDVEGICNQIAEGGLGVLLREPVPEGRTITLNFTLPTHLASLHLKGVVCYEYGYQHGVRFLPLNEEELLAIRQFCSQLPSLAGS